MTATLTRPNTTLRPSLLSRNTTRETPTRAIRPQVRKPARTEPVYAEPAETTFEDGIPEPAPTFDLQGNYTLDPEVQLMLRVQAGDLTAFEELVGRNQERVFAIVFRFVRRRDVAEDLAQQVFLRVFRSAARYTPKARFVTWLYRVCVNTALNHIRNDSRRKCCVGSHAQNLEGEGRNVADTSCPPPWHNLAREETESRIWAAVETLPERQRAALILRTDGMSYEDIADTLSLTTIALKSLLARARSRLKEMLDEVLAA